MGELGRDVNWGLQPTQVGHMMIGNGGGSRANRINVTHLFISVNGNGDVMEDRIIEVNIIVGFL